MTYSSYITARSNLIAFIRANSKQKYAPTYNYCGEFKSVKKLPIWYSDTCKLCYPKKYFSEQEVLTVKNLIENYLKDNNLSNDVIVSYDNDDYIAALHCEGYRLKCKFIVK